MQTALDVLKYRIKVIDNDMSQLDYSIRELGSKQVKLEAARFNYTSERASVEQAIKVLEAIKAV